MTSRFWALLTLLVALVAAGVVLGPRLEGDAPEIGELAPFELGTGKKKVVLQVSDPGSGLRSVELRVDSREGPKSLEARYHPGGLLNGGDTRDEQLELTLDAESLGLPDGAAMLVVVARDWSLRDGLAGNRVERSFPFEIDTVAPKISVESGLTYVHRGGSAAVVYRLGEQVDEDGVRVGGAFFPGHPLPAERTDALARVALFAIPVEAAADPSVLVVARDAAGNESQAAFPVRVLEREFEESTIRLSRGFLDGKVRPLAEAHGLAGSSLGDSFREVNETLRARNEKHIRAIVQNASSTRHWQGGFAQMRGSKVTSRFAEQRSYVWEDRPVSHATHYGFDLASTRRAEVGVANAGEVVFADDLGIYGRCVIVDHGLGVHSLYGHLSQIDVEPGQTLARGHTIGRSGATGLAGGDHLHFAILVGGQYVDPLEWWDPKWVRSHVERRLAPQTPAGG